MKIKDQNKIPFLHRFVGTQKVLTSMGVNAVGPGNRFTVFHPHNQTIFDGCISNCRWMQEMKVGTCFFMAASPVDCRAIKAHTSTD